jgi:hypothetical protein
MNPGYAVNAAVYSRQIEAGWASRLPEVCYSGVALALPGPRALQDRRHP